MRIGIFGRLTRTTDLLIINDFLKFLQAEGVYFCMYDEYSRSLNSQLYPGREPELSYPVFDKYIPGLACDVVYSIGGDGTFLDCVRMVSPFHIPILGVNVGRLGFLATTNQADLKSVTKKILKGEFHIQTRDMLALESNPNILFKEYNVALNEVTIHKSNSNEMIIVHVYADDKFMNTYWADGLIVSTPTGSTAYSLACGGPIISPLCDVWAITPIAPHALTVRPIIVPTTTLLAIEVESRSGQCLVALDNRNELVQEHVRLTARKANLKAKVISFDSHNYYDNLRSRLNWGLDNRN